MEESIIFGYYLMNAWEVEIDTILVFDRETNNISRLKNQKNLDKQFTIPYDEITKIKNIIDNSELFGIKEFEEAPVFDGTSHKFYFKVGNKTKILKCCNLWYWQEDNTSKNARILLDAFNEINDILMKYDIKMRLDY